MKDGGEATESAPEAVTQPVNGTPASSKKAAATSAKKRTPAVPEHKSKKLNRKKSKPTLRLDVQPGEL